MWFKVEDRRNSTGQRFIVRCASAAGGSKLAEERPVQGVTAARKAAELLSASLNMTATVYGSDADGEFVYGVWEVAQNAEGAQSPLIKRLYAESAASSLALKDRLLADIPEETIKGFATLAAALGYLVAHHKEVKRAAKPQISYATLYKIFCGPAEPTTLSLQTDDATLALLSRTLSTMSGWMELGELTGVGQPDRNVIMPNLRPNKVTLNIDGELHVLRPRTAFRGTVPETGSQFMLIMQSSGKPGFGYGLDSIGLVYAEPDEAAVVALVRRLLQQSNPFKNSDRARQPRSSNRALPHIGSVLG